MKNNTSTDFSDFDPKKYLREYYTAPCADDPTLKFCLEESEKITERSIGIDIGSGPVVQYWAALTRKLAGIFLSDFNHQNTLELAKWVCMDSDAHDWDNYIAMMIRYKNCSNVPINYIKEAIRQKVLGYIYCDVTQPQVVNIQNRFDLVSSFYCADSITSSKDLFLKYLSNILSLVSYDGLFIGASLYNCDHYNVGNITFPAANVSQEDIYNVMIQNGFSNKSIRLEITDDEPPSDPKERFEYLNRVNSQLILFSGKKEMD